MSAEKCIVGNILQAMRDCRQHGVEFSKVLDDAARTYASWATNIRLTPEFKFEMERVNAMHWSMREEYAEGYMSPADAVEANVRKNLL